ncbi:MAG: GAF domain-containing protein [Thermoplasmata archaeon]
MSVHVREVTPALLQIDAILVRLSGTNAFAEVSRFLRRQFPHYGWVGIYRTEGDELVLDGWDGPAPTEHVRIPIGRGVCGRAAREQRTVVVSDVTADPEYLACFLDTRAEIVVPIRRGDRVLGEIDIDGTSVSAFDASDARFLEAAAAKLAAAWPDGPTA